MCSASPPISRPVTRSWGSCDLICGVIWKGVPVGRLFGLVGVRGSDGLR